MKLGVTNAAINSMQIQGVSSHGPYQQTKDVDD